MAAKLNIAILARPNERADEQQSAMKEAKKV